MVVVLVLAVGVRPLVEHVAGLFVAVATVIAIVIAAVAGIALAAGKQVALTVFFDLACTLAAFVGGVGLVEAGHNIAAIGEGCCGLCADCRRKD